MIEKEMTPLLERHYNELHFDLYLRHKATGQFIGQSRLVDNTASALSLDSGPTPPTVRSLFLTFAEDCRANWLLMCHSPSEFEIYSELGEM